MNPGVFVASQPQWHHPETFGKKHKDTQVFMGLVEGRKKKATLLITHRQRHELREFCKESASKFIETHGIHPYFTSTVLPFAFQTLGPNRFRRFILVSSGLFELHKAPDNNKALFLFGIHLEDALTSEDKV